MIPLHALEEQAPKTDKVQKGRRGGISDFFSLRTTLATLPALRRIAQRTSEPPHQSREHPAGSYSMLINFRATADNRVSRVAQVSTPARLKREFSLEDETSTVTSATTSDSEQDIKPVVPRSPKKKQRVKDVLKTEREATGPKVRSRAPAPMAAHAASHAVR